MRLTCPNCSARYEVDDSLVPPEGRDVQCSNCATTWFQPGNRSRMEEVETEIEDAPIIDQEDGQEDEQEDEGPAPEPPTRRELDPAIRDLLNEEREREEQLRRASSAAMESQDEMPLEDPAPAPEPEAVPPEDEDEDAETLAALRAATAIGTASAAPSGRDLLPDIEEINSTLRATTDRNANDQDASDIETVEELPRRRRGFRLGLLLMLLIAAGAVAVYAYAPEIAEAVPQAEPALTGYVEQVNAFRFWLDGLVQGLAERLNTTAGEG